MENLDFLTVFTDFMWKLYWWRQIEPNQEEEEIQEEDVGSEAGLEDKIIPENYRSQHQMQAEGEAEFDDPSDFENIWEPRQENNNGSNIVEIEDSYDEIDILNDDPCPNFFFQTPNPEKNLSGPTNRG